MIISITTCMVNKDQMGKVEKFLESFLPRMRKQPGVVAIYHAVKPEKGEESTIAIWESEAALKAYRKSELIKEINAHEAKLELLIMREISPLIFAL
jgi:quinol monooxygenase YgiN